MKLVKVWNEDRYINCNYIISVNIETVFQKTDVGNYKIIIRYYVSDNSVESEVIYRAEDLKSCAFAVEWLANYKGDGIIDLQNMDKLKKRLNE